MNRPLPIQSTQAFVGIQYGYIIVPPDVDRTLFVEQCYRRERVSILVERGGGVIHECYITREAIQRIEFPQTSKQLGSCVLFLTDIFSGLPIIFGVLSKEDESQLLKEGTFYIRKIFQGSSVIISGDARQGILSLSVDGGEISQLNISITNSARDATLNIRSGGVVNIESDKNTNIQDEKFCINKGSQAMVLGGELKTQLNKTNQYLSDLYSALYSTFQFIDAMVPGASAAFQAAMLGKEPGDYDGIESKESFLD